MRILILGGDGMLGHRLFKHLRQTHDARVTLRRELADYAGYGLFDRDTAYAGIDVRSDDRLKEVVAGFRPRRSSTRWGLSSNATKRRTRSRASRSRPSSAPARRTRAA
jgi:nucleoside-diphosphate-sugar epimerase